MKVTKTTSARNVDAWRPGSLIRKDGAWHVVDDATRRTDDHGGYIHTLTLRPASSEEAKQGEIGELKSRLSGMVAGPSDERDRSAFDAERDRIDNLIRALEGRPSVKEEMASKEAKRRADFEEQWRGNVYDRLANLRTLAGRPGLPLHKNVSWSNFAEATGIPVGRLMRLSEGDPDESDVTDEELRKIAPVAGVTFEQLKEGGGEVPSLDTVTKVSTPPAAAPSIPPAEASPAPAAAPAGASGGKADNALADFDSFVQARPHEKLEISSRTQEERRKTAVPNYNRLSASAKAMSQARSGEEPAAHEVYEKLKQEQSDLTPAQFRALLQQMDDAGEIELRPYTRAMSRLPSPELSLPLRSEIMYFVGAPRRAPAAAPASGGKAIAHPKATEAVESLTRLKAESFSPEMHGDQEPNYDLIRRRTAEIAAQVPASEVAKVARALNLRATTKEQLARAMEDAVRADADAFYGDVGAQNWGTLSEMHKKNLERMPDMLKEAHANLGAEYEKAAVPRPPKNPPTPPKPPATPRVPSTLKAASATATAHAERVRAAVSRISRPGSTREEAEQAVADLNLGALSRNDLRAIAKEVGGSVQRGTLASANRTDLVRAIEDIILGAQELSDGIR